jgi:hypothetical protein
MDVDIQIEIIKKMSPNDKLKIAERLYWSAYELRYAAFKTQYPDLSEEEIAEKTKKYFLHAK